MNLTQEELEELLGQNPEVTVAGPENMPKIMPVSTSILPHQSESSFQREVISFLQGDGWRVCEFRKARIKKGGVDVYRTPFGADGVGMVDCIAVKPPRVLFIENKSAKGSASPEQMQWLLLLGKCPGVETFVLTPEGFERFKDGLRGK